jgi:hypothetical protein
LYFTTTEKNLNPDQTADGQIQRPLKSFVTPHEGEAPLKVKIDPPAVKSPGQLHRDLRLQKT